MLIETKQLGTIVVVEPKTDRLDARNAPEFKQQIIELIHRGNNSIVIAMNHVDFVDSSGLGAMISALKTLGVNGDMVIAGTRKTVYSLFKLTRMDKVFRMFENTEAAINSLSK